MQPTLLGLHLVEGAANWLCSFLLRVPVVRSGIRGVMPDPAQETLVSQSFSCPPAREVSGRAGSRNPQRVQVLFCHPLAELSSSLAWSDRASNLVAASGT